MPAYVVAMLRVTDPGPLAQYARETAPVTEQYGGRYLFAGPGAEVLEGDSTPDSMAIIEFPTPEDARRWHASAEYAPLRELREAAGFMSMIVTPNTGAPS
jgi:uncharacterized protein (DUF1330 family)